MEDENVIARHMPLLLLVAALAVLTLAGSAASAPPPAPPDPTCSPGPSDCSAWHRDDVTVSWSSPPAGANAVGCGSVTISTDTNGTPVSCTWSNVDGARTTTTNVRRDGSPPRTGAVPERGPDNGGWYNRGVSIAFSGDDPNSGVASCSSASYSGPDTAAVSIRGSCTDNAGNTGTAYIEIKYDASPPKVEAKPKRRPNAKGWYNREVTVAFVGSDATSGVDSCVPAVTYKGPDAPKAAVSGTCTDKAANTSPPAGFELKYDTRPPTLARVKAEITGHGIVLRWKASKDTLSVGVVRRPGLKGNKPSMLYTGRARLFADRRLEAGIKYRYTVTAYDEAGNASVKGVAAQLSSPIEKPAVTRPAATKPALTKPALGARVKAPPLLAWRAVPKATYYNVQLYRDGRKILTVWPGEPSFLVQRSWRYGGRSYRLTPGRYRWYVWPGFGPRSATNYGKLIGTRYFVVTRT